jgi:hypothetical protein
MAADLQAAIRVKLDDMGDEISYADRNPDLAVKRAISSITPGMAWDFSWGTVYSAEQSGTHIVLRGIQAQYELLGGPSGFLGYPVSDVLTANAGKVVFFSNGAIFEDAVGATFLVFRPALNDGVTARARVANQSVQPTEVNLTAAPSTLALDFSGNPVPIPISGQAPTVVFVLDPNLLAPAQVGVIALSNDPSALGGGGSLNPNDGPSSGQIAQGIAGAVLGSLFGTQPGIIGTSLSMLGH